MAKSTGGGGSVTISGTSIPFRTIEPNVEKEYDDSTDSTNYDVASGIVHKAQLGVATQTTFDVEGVYDPAIMTTTVVQTLYSNPGAVPAVIKSNLSTTYGHGNVDISNFKLTIAPDKTGTFSMTMMTNGVFTPGS